VAKTAVHHFMPVDDAFQLVIDLDVSSITVIKSQEFAE
jgi:hypothetical protein